MSRRQEAREKRQLRQWSDDLAWLMADERGRRILANLMERGAHGSDVFTGNSQGNYLQGRQSLINELVKEIRIVAFPHFQRMEREAMKAKQIDPQEALQDDDAE